MTANNIQSPTEMPLVTPSSEVAPVGNNKFDSDNGKVQMKKQLGLTEGTAIILGIIFGSGKRKLGIHSHCVWNLKFICLI